ncbi:MAG: NFACT RNA binding domain-containing protein [Spirochaetota bacterium]
MSLNWREIDAVVSELDLPGAFVQQVIQPDFRNLYLEIFRPGRRLFVRISLETGKTRIHSTTHKPRKPRVRQRFAQLLHARIKGAHIADARQVNADRIVRIDLERASERTILWIRLWGGAANCIVTDGSGQILDAFFRRPGRGEISGQRYFVEDEDVDPASDPKLDSFTPRWESEVDAHVRAHYDEIEQAERRTKALESARSALTGREAAARKRLDRLAGRRDDGTDPDRLRTLGELIVSNLYRIEGSATRVEVEDYTNDNTIVSIDLDPALTPQENAQAYFDRAGKARRRQEALDEERQNLRARLADLESTLASLDERSTPDLERIVEEAAPRRRGAGSDEGVPGLQFESAGFRILVGRNARENDALLRRHVRGNDVWLHTRDFPGGHVFVRARKGKSVPLDVLLDAGNLAVHFSRAKTNGRADLYYTHVKYLRRAKDGPAGLVLPTQEKNLHVVVEPERLSRLLGRDEP